MLTVISAEAPPTTMAGFNLTLVTLFFWTAPATTLPWLEAMPAKPPGLLGFEPEPQPANTSRLAANIKGGACNLTMRKVCYLVS